jgi:hypothetical protein
MAYQNKLLLRVSLDDDGTPIDHGSYSQSPDIISHALVNDPQKEFGANYASDPNQAINKNSKTNPVYARVKSLQPANELVSGYVRLYRASASLFLNSDQWRNNPLYTPQGKTYVTVSAQKAGDVSVGNDTFMLDGTQQNYCIVGIVNDSTAETVPEEFNLISDFIMWVHTNPAVGVRNFRLISSGTANDYEALIKIINPENNARSFMIKVHAENLPDGTVFGMENTALKLNKSGVFYESDELSHDVLDASVWPANYDGYLRVYAKLPTGAKWPSDARFTVEYYVAANLDEAMAVYGFAPEEITSDPSVLSALPAAGKLVLVGECSVEFI